MNTTRSPLFRLSFSENIVLLVAVICLLFFRGKPLSFSVQTQGLFDRLMARSSTCWVEGKFLPFPRVTDSRSRLCCFLSLLHNIEQVDSTYRVRAYTGRCINRWTWKGNCCIVAHRSICTTRRADVLLSYPSLLYFTHTSKWPAGHAFLSCSAARLVTFSVYKALSTLGLLELV